MHNWFNKSLSSMVRLLFPVLGVMALTLSPGARADMLISPVRALLQQPGETTEFILRNPSDGPRTYRLEWIEQRQSSHGVGARYAEGEIPAHPQASPHLRFTPRQVTVEPNSNQSVRINFRPDGDLAPGEYRSHLLFRVVPEVSEPVSRSTVGAGEGMQLTLDMQLSIAVPVVVRYQVNKPPLAKIAQVTPLPASNLDQTARLMVSFTHQGKSSAFGRVTVDLQHSADAPVERIGLLENISIFPDVGERQLEIILRDRDFPPGSLLRVAYEGTDEYRGTMWDEQVLQVR